VDPHVEAFGDGDLVGLLCRLGSWLTELGTHREGSRWDVGQFESDTSRNAFGWWHRSATGKADCGNQEQNEGYLRGLTHWTDGQKRNGWTIRWRCGGRLNHGSWI
jgi:hypothetical protein